MPAGFGSLRMRLAAVSTTNTSPVRPRRTSTGPLPQPDRVPGKVVPEATFQAGGKLFDGPCHGHIAEHDMREGLRRDSDARHGQPCGHQQAAGHHVRRFSVHGFRHRGVDKRLFQPHGLHADGIRPGRLKILHRAGPVVPGAAFAPVPEAHTHRLFLARETCTEPSASGISTSQVETTARRRSVSTMRGLRSTSTPPTLQRMLIPSIVVIPP